MDPLTFVAEVLRSSMWPAVAIVGICVFRKELRALLGQIKKGKVGAAEFEFERALPSSTDWSGLEVDQARLGTARLQSNLETDSAFVRIPDLSPNELR